MNIHPQSEVVFCKINGRTHRGIRLSVKCRPRNNSIIVSLEDGNVYTVPHFNVWSTMQITMKVLKTAGWVASAVIMSIITAGLIW